MTDIDIYAFIDMSADEQLDMVWDTPLENSSYIVLKLSGEIRVFTEKIREMRAVRAMIVKAANRKFAAAHPASGSVFLDEGGRQCRLT
jgi:hypothetical protein